MSKGLKPGHSGIHDVQAEAPSRGIRRRIIACLVACFALTILWLAAAYASGGAEKEGPNWFDFVWRLFNFLALVGVLYWLLAKKTKDFFAGRREGIQTSLAEAASARDEAQKKFQEYAAKLDKATGEIDQISAMIQSQGQAEKERIIEDARRAAEKMKEDTESRMEQEFNKASLELRTEAVRLSVEMAEELLKKHIREADHEAMVRDYVEKVTNKR